MMDKFSKNLQSDKDFMAVVQLIRSAGVESFLFLIDVRRTGGSDWGQTYAIDNLTYE
ncbi:MAG: hypothetical protein P9M00_09850 [Candidatus Tritonobacter lacicola]|nr:hypothetical protein [Candidatus Tritonobacter lacicola]